MDQRGSSDPVYRISGAPLPLSDDINARTRRYLVLMAIRTVCFLGGVVAWVAWDQVVLAWILLFGSLLLPYLAVVIANAGRERRKEPPTATLHQDRDALPGADHSPPAP
jgi:Na+(H+)/acetate symporter ActP